MQVKKIFFMLCMFIVLTMTISLAETSFSGISDVEAAQKIKISKKKAALFIGETLKLKVKGTSKKVKWSSNKKSIASVSSKGKVKAKKTGVATITAKVGNKRYKCKVTVKSGLIADKTQISLDDTSSIKVKVTIKRRGEIWYHIADTNIVSCQWSNQLEGNNAFLTISGRRKGSTIVTISNEDTKEAIKLYVVVTHKPIAVSKVTLSKTSLSLYKDDTYTLTAAISPTNADNQKIIWKSSNTKVATVTNGVIRAVGAGSARITATVGNISAACNVTVKNAINIKVITQLPKELSYMYSYNYYIYSKINITDFQIEITKKTNGYYGTIIYSGEKTYDRDGEYGTHTCFFRYKLYDSKGNVVKTERLSKSGLLVGDKFKNASWWLGELPLGDYTLELLDEY